MAQRQGVFELTSLYLSIFVTSRSSPERTIEPLVSQQLFPWSFIKDPCNRWASALRYCRTFPIPIALQYPPFIFKP